MCFVHNNETYVGCTIYIYWLSYGIWMLRWMCQIAWMSSGWPQWVSPERGDEYDIEINSFYSLLAVSQIFANVAFGLLSEFLRKIFHRPDQPDYGSGISLLICCIIFTTSLCLNQILGAQQNEAAGYASVVFFCIARACGGFFWYMVPFYFFPVEIFGLIYGIAGLVSLPIMTLNIPIHAYIMEHESFALMSYVTCGLRMVPYYSYTVHDPKVEHLFV